MANPHPSELPPPTIETIPTQQPAALYGMLRRRMLGAMEAAMQDGANSIEYVGDHAEYELVHPDSGFEARIGQGRMPHYEAGQGELLDDSTYGLFVKLDEPVSLRWTDDTGVPVLLVGDEWRMTIDRNGVYLYPFSPNTKLSSGTLEPLDPSRLFAPDDTTLWYFHALLQRAVVNTETVDELLSPLPDDFWLEGVVHARHEEAYMRGLTHPAGTNFEPVDLEDSDGQTYFLRQNDTVLQVLHTYTDPVDQDDCPVLLRLILPEPANLDPRYPDEVDDEFIFSFDPAGGGLIACMYDAVTGDVQTVPGS